MCIILPVVFFVWVWNLASQIKGRTQIVNVWEQGVEENILS
jgi:hypothetical protein